MPLLASSAFASFSDLSEVDLLCEALRLPVGTSGGCVSDALDRRDASWQVEVVGIVDRDEESQTEF